MLNISQRPAPPGALPDTELLELEKFMHDSSLYNQSLYPKPKKSNEKYHNDQHIRNSRHAA